MPGNRNLKRNLKENLRELSLGKRCTNEHIANPFLLSRDADLVLIQSYKNGKISSNGPNIQEESDVLAGCTFTDGPHRT